MSMKTLNLFGLVYPASDCINAEAVANFLKDLKESEEFTVYINSYGGNVFEGLAIYNLLSEKQSQMTIKIIGEATSIASVITCAGAPGKVLIAETALMLIHKPWTFASLDEDSAKKLQKELGTVKKSIIAAYQRKTGLDADYLDSLMTDADYHDAKDCVKLGFADAVYVPSETETTEIAKSNNLKNEILKKYLILNLKNENYKPSINEGDYMTFKNLDEAVVEIGRLSEKLTSVENQLQSANQKNEQQSAVIQSQTAEIQNANAQLNEIRNQLMNSESTVANLQEQAFNNEASLFCEKQFLAGKLTRAEINGQADLTKNEIPAKVAKLVALRKLSQELYDMECREIEDKSSETVNFLSSQVPGGSATPSSEKNFLVNHIEEKYNKRKK